MWSCYLPKHIQEILARQKVLLTLIVSISLFLVYPSPCPLEVRPPDPQWTRKDNLRLRLIWRPPLSSSGLMRKYLESSVSHSRGIFFPSNPAASLNYSAGTVTQRRDKAAPCVLVSQGCRSRALKSPTVYSAATSGLL